MRLSVLFLLLFYSSPALELLFSGLWAPQVFTQLVELLPKHIQATIIGGHASFRKAPETPDPFAQEV